MYPRVLVSTRDSGGGERGAVWGDAGVGRISTVHCPGRPLLPQSTRKLRHWGSWYADSRTGVSVGPWGGLHRGPVGDRQAGIQETVLLANRDAGVGAMHILAAGCQMPTAYQDYPKC